MAEAPHCSGACACSEQGVNLSIKPPVIHAQIVEQAHLPADAAGKPAAMAGVSARYGLFNAS